MPLSTPGFDPNTFEFFWASLGKDARLDLISRAGTFPPTLGILPIVKGLSSFRFNTREGARQSLKVLLAGIREKLCAPPGSEVQKLARLDAVSVSGRLFHQISPELPFAEQGILFGALLELFDDGAFFAFKALYLRRISMESLKRMILDSGEYERLIFTDQFLRATPGVRLKYAALFKDILKSIETRKPVVAFYAGLFDRNRTPDLFLTHIAQNLRDPVAILKNEALSPSPETKIMAFKALAMLQSKISPTDLHQALEGEEVKKMRIAIYSLIKNSSMGTYPELFNAIFDHFVKADTSEWVPAFKAMVLTGAKTPHQIFNLIRTTCPKALPALLFEISKLSRISFFVIQDMALNKDIYLKEHLDVNLACIFGMVKKRPERIIRILRDFEERQGQPLAPGVKLFIKKASLLLKKEKEYSSKKFSDLALGIDEPEGEKTKGLLKAVLKDPLEKKLDRFFQGGGSGAELNFAEERICDRDLRRFKDAGSTAFFTHVHFQNCNLKGVSLNKVCFNQAVFYNVNMAGVRMQGICFDQAVFINVDARSARFENCSFQGARFFNCNFNDSYLACSNFIGAEFAKTTFARTDLTCACFAESSISGIVFTTADLTLADFSGVRARFSRFPAHTNSLFRTEDLDCNARYYQLTFKDLPQLDKAMVNEFNMLIFCEFIQYGEGKFLNQNKLSLLMAFDLFKPSQADFFQMLPLLLHKNFDATDILSVPMSTPCGICDYRPSREAISLASRHLGIGRYKAAYSPDPCIEGVFSMGSVGSLAQTPESDIDYWICIDERNMDQDGIGLLRQKLTAIEKLAWEKFKVRVTFFLMDVLKARNNDFGGSTQESSGSAQSRLLKEEFYRTMIHVAGKLPLWAVLPTNISLNYYSLILNRTNRFSESPRYLDLGDIHAIPVNEYFGASIWQMFKWLKSPFKSVIKMALLEKYIESYGQETLLCNQYKNEWMNSGSHLKPGQNDSYIILINTLVDFYKGLKDNRSASLLLTCFFLKLGISKPSEVGIGAFGMRRLLLDASLAQWGWNYKKVFEVGRFTMWPYSAIHRLSMTIERYMVSKYKDLKHRFDTQSVSGLMISEQDRIVLERKVNVVFHDKPHKIKQLVLVSRGDRHFSRLHIKYLPGPKDTWTWGLVHRIQRQEQQMEEKILEAATIEEIGAWLICNHLYTDRTFLGLVPNPTQVSHENIERLFRAMYAFFSPQIDGNTHFKTLRQQPWITRLFVSANFYDKKHQVKVSDYSVIYMNSWGEMYLRSSRPGISVPSLAETGKLILKGLSLDQFPKRSVFYTQGIMQTPEGGRYRL